MTDPPIQVWTRSIAIDIHKHYLMIGGIDAYKRIVLQPRKVELARWPQWAQANLHPTDAVVIEATTNAWVIYDQVVTLVGRVVVAQRAKVKLIADARIKTDKVDVLTLAQLLRADMLPEVWVPPPHVRDLRALLSHRRRLVSLQTSAKNRLQSVLHRLNLRPPDGERVRLRSSAHGGRRSSSHPPSACGSTRMWRHSTTSARRLRRLTPNYAA
jgi:transposase